MKNLMGAIVEIKTDGGLAYALCTHKNEKYHYLLRVFKGFYDSRPDDLDDVMSNEVQFSAFFPLGVALRKGIFEVAGHSEIPDELRRFPMFRGGFVDRDSRKILDWFLWDGEKTYKVGKLNDEQKAYPIRGVWNDTLLITRIENGYTPQTDPLT